MHLSERLMGIVNQVLEVHNLQVNHLGCIAIGVGPGSFTGTRIGVTTAKTLATVLQCRLYGVSTLQALAEPYCGLVSHIVGVMLPCRKSVVFAAAYDVSGPEPVELLTPQAVEVELFRAQLSALKKPVLLCGEGSPSLVVGSADNLLQTVSTVQWPAAHSIGRLAFRRIALQDLGDDPLTLTPTYLAPPPISQPKVPIPQPPRTSDL